MSANSKVNWLSPQFKLYVFSTISKKREIKCAKCGSYKNLELHHKRYAPQDNVAIKDIELLCSKCHRNSKQSLSKVSTVFKNGKRYCVGNNFRFEY